MKCTSRGRLQGLNRSSHSPADPGCGLTASGIVFLDFAQVAVGIVVWSVAFEIDIVEHRTNDRSPSGSEQIDGVTQRFNTRASGSNHQNNRVGGRPQQSSIRKEI